MQSGDPYQNKIYMLVNKAQDLAIKLSQTDYKKYQESRLVGQLPNPEDDGQLYMIVKVGKKQDEYEIVNLKSNLVFTQDGKEILLEYGSQKGSQLFAITKSTFSAFYTYYWIKTSLKGDKALYLEGSLKYGTFDPNAQNQMWRLEEVKGNKTLNTSGLIINNWCGKALDVPGATFQSGERLIQYQINRRFNQRWRFIKSGQGYLIQSVLNGYFLDISQESRQDQAEVIQWKMTGNPNQQWLPQSVGKNLYKIKSLHQKGMYLTIKGDSKDDGGKLEVSNKNKKSLVWFIEGFIP